MENVLGNDGIHHCFDRGILGSQVRVIPVIEILGIVDYDIFGIAFRICKLHV
jgi:hypothetical protein